MAELADMAGHPPEVKGKSKLREHFESIILALILALVIRAFVVQPFKIPSGSMEDTLLVGDYILVNKFIYGIRVPFVGTPILKLSTPGRGDVLVFKFPEDRSKDYIKRVIGTPGDEILIRDKQVYVNGVLAGEPHAMHKDPLVMPRSGNPRDNFGPVRVPADSYFVMGDNRDRSFDSRFWGFVKDKDLEGKAFIKHWSWDSEAHRVRWERIGRTIE